MSWTTAGFQRQRLPDLLEALEDDLRQSLGPSVDLSSGSVLGRLAGIFSVQLSEVYELAEAVAWSRSPDGAVDESLDAVVALSAMERQAGETDSALRGRWLAEISGVEAASLDAIRAVIEAVPGVERATVLENSREVAVSGRPPCSLELIVDGTSGAAADQAVATALWAVRPAGVVLTSTLGMPVSVPITDAGGNPQTVTFSRVQMVELWMWVTVTAHPEEELPSGWRSLMEDALAAQMQSIRTGEDVVVSRLAAVLYPIPGVYDLLVEVSASAVGPRYRTKLKIGPAERARLDLANITFTLLP